MKLDGDFFNDIMTTVSIHNMISSLVALKSMSMDSLNKSGSILSGLRPPAPCKSVLRMGCSSQYAGYSVTMLPRGLSQRLLT